MIGILALTLLSQTQLDSPTLIDAGASGGTITFDARYSANGQNIWGISDSFGFAMCSTSSDAGFAPDGAWKGLNCYNIEANDLGRQEMEINAFCSNPDITICSVQTVCKFSFFGGNVPVFSCPTSGVDFGGVTVLNDIYLGPLLDGGWSLTLSGSDGVVHTTGSVSATGSVVSGNYVAGSIVQAGDGSGNALRVYEGFNGGMDLDATISGNAEEDIRLRPKAGYIETVTSKGVLMDLKPLPSTCLAGTLLPSSADGRLYYCNPANTWSAISP